jgi:hypothetical protein
MRQEVGMWSVEYGDISKQELFACGPVTEATAWLLSNQSGSGYGLSLGG